MCKDHLIRELPRYALGAVTLWFGVTQLFVDPAYFLGFLLSWTLQLPLEQLTLIFLNGLVDLFIGIALLIGWQTRIAASGGYNDVAIRDFGLSLVALSIALQPQKEHTHGQHH